MNPEGYTTDINSVLFLKSYSAVEEWVRLRNYQGWDPYDGLNSKLIQQLTFNNRKMGQIWLQLFKRNPINFRPLFRIQKGYNPKGISLFLLSYLRHYQAFGSKADFDCSQYFADWLCSHISPGYYGACWGYNFDWPNRGGWIRAGVPTVVNSSFIGLSLLEFLRQCKREKLPYKRYLDVVLQISQFILIDLNRQVGEGGAICFSYTPNDRSQVHNANLLAAQFLAEIYAEVKNEEFKEYALKSARFSASRQATDGSWFYGEETNNHWIDNFHTGFVLVSLKRVGECLLTNEYIPVIQKGYSYWKENLFLDQDVPKYYPNQVYPIDIHSVAQAIVTFLEYQDIDDEGFTLAKKITTWGIRHFQNPRGFFYYQINRFYTNRIPYMRWGQAWMLRALSELLFSYHSLPQNYDSNIP